MSGRYQSPTPLNNRHTFENFRCASLEQTSWLHQHSRHAHASGATKVFVVTEPAGVDIVAYYAWRMAELALANAPERLKKGAGKYPQPIALLARLGVDERHEGKGIGAALLSDVIRRILNLNKEIGCRGLLIHAETTAPREFYLHLIPELIDSPTDRLHLVLLMKDVRHTLLAD